MPTFEEPTAFETEQTVVKPIATRDTYDIHSAVLDNKARLSTDFPLIVQRYGTDIYNAQVSAATASRATKDQSNPLEAYVVRDKNTQDFLGIATLCLLNRKSGLVLNNRPRFSDLIAGWSINDTPDGAALEVAEALTRRSAERMAVRRLNIGYIPDLVTAIRPENKPAISLAAHVGMSPRKDIGPGLLRLAGIHDGVTAARQLWTKKNPYQI